MLGIICIAPLSLIFLFMTFILMAWDGKTLSATIFFTNLTTIISIIVVGLLFVKGFFILIK